MAVPGAKNPTTLKTYFETGDIPTESQFADLIDNSYNKAEGLGIKETVTDDVSVVIPPERMLVELAIWSPTTQQITVGDSLGSTEYMDDLVIANVPYILDLKVFAITQKTLYVQGSGTINVKKYIK